LLTPQNNPARSGPASDAPAAARTVLSVPIPRGTQLNGLFEIDVLLASGGMGEVYCGHSIQTGDKVAIKVIRADLADNEVAISMFRNEAAALYHLHHEAIVRYFVFSIDPSLQRAYLAMEFVEGESLSQIFQRGPMRVETLCVLAERVALGLYAAHKRGIIHRDVSPDNIIIQNGDVREAKIIDFGIARSTHAATTLINVGFVGKYNYVSPEQLGLYKGNATRDADISLTPKSDIYSLGLVLAEALSGSRIDMGETQAQIVEKRKTLPDLAGIDARIRPLLEKMLQPDADLRPASMLEVAEYLRNLPEAGGSRRHLRNNAFTRATRASHIALAAGLAVVFGSGVGAYWLWTQGPSPRPPTAALKPPPMAPERQPDAVVPPPVQASPEDNAPAPGGRLDRVVGFIERHQAGPCFSITSFAATDASAKIEVAGNSPEPFDALDKDFKAAFQFEADIRAVVVTQAQCAALTFFNSMKANLHAPRLEAPRRVDGRSLTGSILDVGDRKIEVLVVQDDGLVQSATHFVQPGRAPFTFNIPVERLRAGTQPQLLMVVASGEPLSSLKPSRPLPADRLFLDVTAEATAKQEPLGVAMQYFQLE
jgi:serine/threonine-protein kinase